MHAIVVAQTEGGTVESQPARGLAIQLSQGQDRQPLRPEGVPPAAGGLRSQAAFACACGMVLPFHRSKGRAISPSSVPLHARTRYPCWTGLNMQCLRDGTLASRTLRRVSARVGGTSGIIGIITAYITLIMCDLLRLKKRWVARHCVPPVRSTSDNIQRILRMVVTSRVPGVCRMMKLLGQTGLQREME